MNNRRLKSKAIQLKYSGIGRSNVRNMSTIIPLDSSNLNENKEKMINDAIECVRNEIPKTLMQMDEFYNEIIKFTDDNYDKPMTENDFANIRNVWLKKLEKFWPFDCESQCESKQNSNKTFINDEKCHPYSECVRHLNNLHHQCYNHYSFLEALTIFPEISSSTMISNEFIVRFSDRLRAIVINLAEKLLKINMGFSFLIPKTEDNEESDISIEILDRVLALTSYDCSIDFDEIFNERGKLIRTINEHPQSEETCFMLKEYDHETCLQIQYELQSIMTQCYCLYDVIIKNFDKIIKSKQSYKRTDNNNINDNDNYNDDYRSALYS